MKTAPSAPPVTRNFESGLYLQPDESFDIKITMPVNIQCRHLLVTIPACP